MSKKSMSLQAWLEKEFELKKEFLTQEILNNEMFKAIHISEQKQLFIPKAVDLDQPSEKSPLPIQIPFHEKLGYGMALDKSTFEILKQKFRTFKFQKKNKIEDRVKLQIHLKKNTLSQLDQISCTRNFKYTEQCLVLLINKYNSIQQEDSEEVQKLKAELLTKNEEISRLKQLVSSQRRFILHEKNKKMQSRDDMVDHLIQVAIKANCKLAEYESFINNHPNFNTEVVPLLSQEEAQKIKSKFEKDLELKRHEIYVLNSNQVEGIDSF